MKKNGIAGEHITRAIDMLESARRSVRFGLGGADDFTALLTEAREELYRAEHSVAKEEKKS